MAFVTPFIIESKEMNDFLEVGIRHFVWESKANVL